MGKKDTTCERKMHWIKFVDTTSSQIGELEGIEKETMQNEIREKRLGNLNRASVMCGILLSDITYKQKTT